MARKRLSRFLRGAVNTGTAAAPLGPKVAVPLAIGGGVLEALTGGQPKFNRKPYDTAFKNFTDAAWKQTRRASREINAQSGARQSAMGINESPVGGFLHDRNTANIYQGTLDHITQARANLESQVAHAESMLGQSADIRERNKWTQTRNMLLEKLDTFANPEQGGMNVPNLAEMMKEYGFDDATIQDWVSKLGGQMSEGTQGSQPLTVRDHKAGQPGYARVSAGGQHGGNPYVPLNPATGTPSLPSYTPTAPSIPSFGPPKENLIGKSRPPQAPTLEAVKSTLGSFLTTYLTDALGEEFADIFVWE